MFTMVYGFHLDPSKNGLYESLPETSRPSREHFSKLLYQLQHSGYIRKTDDSVFFTKKGEERAFIRHAEQVVLKRKRDGFYRLIAFDVPEKRRFARDLMRAKLYEFECKKVQKSLYLTPYACEEEIEEIASILKMQSNVHVFVLKFLPQLRSLPRSWPRTEVKSRV